MKVKAQELETQISSLSEGPGVYQFYDESGKLLYIGKAKNLKKRVSSYFQKKSEHAKTALLVSKINSIEPILVATEVDALLLENSLIKKHQPRYNVLLKDDKTFPWICIKNEPFPRIFSTRKPIKDGSHYYGPYTSGRLMHALLELIRKLYPLRSCSLLLTEENIKSKKFKICLDYHIGLCKGPCENLQEEQEYNENIAKIKTILKGNIHAIKKELRDLMEHYAQQLDFEKAHVVKEKLALLEKYQSRSAVVSPTIENVDVFNILKKEKNAYINYFKVIDGAIVQSHTLEMKLRLEESEEELLLMGISEIRSRFFSNTKEILVPFEPSIALPDTFYTIPQKGDKKKLLELSMHNLENYAHEKERQAGLVDPQRHSKRILQTLKEDLRMQVLPDYIECFDNSNFQGTHAVAAMTVFKNGKPSKKDYRHFNIKTVEGPNDFASMEEIILRRYKRILDEGNELPKLIVIDGGKGQLSSAMKILEQLNLRGKITVIGIAKRLEEIYFPGDSIPIYLDKRSESLKLIQRIRDEAHRFGITHHRNKRSKATIRTELTSIKGISDATANKLLQKFKSVARIKETELKELEEEIGNAKAQLVYAHFHSA